MEIKTKKHFSGKAIFIPVGITVFIISFLNLFVGINMSTTYERFDWSIHLTEKYKDVSQQFIEGSDILTSELRQYVSTGSQDHLDAYFTEARVTKNRDKAIEAIRQYEIDYKKDNPYLDQAMYYSNALMKVEYHAMKLASEVYHSDLTNYEEVSSYQLNDVEIAMTNDEKLASAASLVNNETYYWYKDTILSKSKLAVDVILEETEIVHLQLASKMRMLLTVMIISTAIFVVLLAFSSIVISSYVLYPLVQAKKRIQKDELMVARHGILEYVTLANAYNELISKRDSLESELKILANTDPLTGLPNRNSIMEIKKSRNSIVYHHVAMLSLDLNQLKETNDSKGHKYGDELLCAAADCILDFFGNDARNNCCRIGGDEFTAFLIQVTEDDVKKKIKAFKEAQPRYGVSIAVGYSYREAVRVDKLDEMYEEADRDMYDDKTKYYESRGLIHHSLKKDDNIN